MKKLIKLLLCLLMFLLVGCIEKETVVDEVPDAENSVFTEKGRLFVTSGENVYEIKKSSDSFYKDEIYEYEENEKRVVFAGITQVKDKLFVVGGSFNPDCSEPPSFSDLLSGNIDRFYQMLSNMFLDIKIFEADLTFTNTVLKPVYTLNSVIMPNGMTSDNEGNIYVVDMAPSPLGKIVKLNSDCLSCSEEIFANYNQNIVLANGLTIYDNTMYFTDNDARNPLNIKRYVKKLPLDYKNGEIAETIFDKTGPSIFDDLTNGELFGLKGILVTDYFKGQLHFIPFNKKFRSRSTPVGSFKGPSSVSFGKGNFDPDELIVTEKGIPFELRSSVGNKVTKAYFSK
ncbi:MAG: hypothetical protein GY714_16295 [Desulfobacterales bacterium]|nr:hypothetical protein [Desulfobacterales bacterium]MCP4163080.1 hypothetical protein [Deltaproteobacteria bacterium]